MFDLRIYIVLLVNVCLVYVLSAVNSELAPVLYISVPAIFIVSAALFLDFLPMLAVVAVSAFLCEATTGVRAGLTAAMWMAAAAAVHSMRFRFRACDWFSITGLTEVLNIILLFFYSIFFYSGSSGFFEYVARVSADAFVSAVSLLFAGRFAVLLPVSIANISGRQMSINGED